MILVLIVNPALLTTPRPTTAEGILVIPQCHFPPTSPYKMVYGKSCHLPLELEYKAYWAIKELNYDFKLAGEKRLFDISSLDEWISQAYENAKLFKEKVKRWHDKRIQKWEFKVGEHVYTILVLDLCKKTSFQMGRTIYH